MLFWRIKAGEIFGAGRLAQSGERMPYKHEVVGSNPAPPILCQRLALQRIALRVVPKNDIISHPPFSAAIAAARGRSSIWLEYQTVDLGVAGSSPVAPAFKLGAATISKTADRKLKQDYCGNPLVEWLENRCPSPSAVSSSAPEIEELPLA